MAVAWENYTITGRNDKGSEIRSLTLHIPGTDMISQCRDNAVAYGLTSLVDKYCGCKGVLVAEQRERSLKPASSHRRQRSRGNKKLPNTGTDPRKKMEVPLPDSSARQSSIGCLQPVRGFPFPPFPIQMPNNYLGLWYSKFI
jgi:hypothetical protein